MSNYKGRIPIRDWSTLKDDYARVKSYAALAREYGCSPDAVEYQAKKQGIETLPRTIDSYREVEYRRDIDWSNLKEDYKTMSVYQIAKKYGCSHQAVYNQIQRLELKKNA